MHGRTTFSLLLLLQPFGPFFLRKFQHLSTHYAQLNQRIFPGMFLLVPTNVDHASCHQGSINKRICQ